MFLLGCWALLEILYSICGFNLYALRGLKFVIFLNSLGVNNVFSNIRKMKKFSLLRFCPIFYSHITMRRRQSFYLHCALHYHLWISTVETKFDPLNSCFHQKTNRMHQGRWNLHQNQKDLLQAPNLNPFLLGLRLARFLF